MTHRYGIAERYGHPFLKLAPRKRQEFAKIALQKTGEKRNIPPCPFQKGRPPCPKRGGVCSIVKYEKDGKNRIARIAGEPAIVCPKRFEEGNVLVRWLAEIVDMPQKEAILGREISFMKNKSPTGLQENWIWWLRGNVGKGSSGMGWKSRPSISRGKA